jgi:hypothetical protein
MKWRFPDRWPLRTAWFRFLPEVLAALVLAWLLRSSPTVLRRHFSTIRETVPQLRDLGYRIPPAHSGELKGTLPAIQWINENVPRNESLQYIGSMSSGIRLRYYTLPRKADWYYVYGKRDVTGVTNLLVESPADWIMVEGPNTFQKLGKPPHWKSEWSDQGGRFVAFKVEREHE